MNTREEIIALLSKSKKPLGSKIIASELKKTSMNIRKILSNLYKEGKITKVGYGEYISSVNVKNKSVNVLGKSVNVLNKSVNVKPESVNLEKLIKEAKREYQRGYRKRNPDYNKNYLRAYYRKYPKKSKEYRRRYWVKKALEIQKGRS